jgi:hypothetical protein
MLEARRSSIPAIPVTTTAMMAITKRLKRNLIFITISFLFVGLTFSVKSKMSFIQHKHGDFHK